MLFDFTAFLSWSLGIICVVLWMLVLVPQFIKTYKTKSSSAVSFNMVLFIFLGDCFSTISALFLETNPIIYSTGIFYIFFDIVFILQWLYYKFNDPNHLQMTFFWRNYPWIRQTNLTEIYIFISSLLLLSCIILLLANNILTYELSFILSWLSVISYFVSRLPQIILNYNRRSTSGLSLYTFIIIFFANIAFFISIIIKGYDNYDYIIRHIPWLIGCIISCVFDIVIFYQFCSYMNDGYLELHYDYQYVPEQSQLNDTSSENSFVTAVE